MISGIYWIRNLVNNKLYIGSAVNFNDRKSLHIKMLTQNHHHSIKLQRAWNKYGSVAFEFKLIEETEKTQLREREQYWIDKYDSFNNGYNCTPSAHNMTGFKHSEKSKKLIGQVQKGRVSNRKGAKLSDETRHKLHLANIGKKLPIHVIEKMRGRKFKMSENGRKNISNALGVKNFYEVLFMDGTKRQINMIHEFCVEVGVKFKILHQWSIKNKNNDRVHPKYGMKLISLNQIPIGNRVKTKSDDEADAILLYQLAIKDLGL